jgi:hypothetical protein
VAFRQQVVTAQPHFLPQTPSSVWMVISQIDGEHGFSSIAPEREKLWSPISWELCFYGETKLAFESARSPILPRHIDSVYKTQQSVGAYRDVSDHFCLRKRVGIAVSRTTAFGTDDAGCSSSAHKPQLNTTHPRFLRYLWSLDSSWPTRSLARWF